MIGGRKGMSYIKAYSHVVEAEVEAGAWDEVYFSLLSLKLEMQALPGWQRFDLWARSLEPDGVRMVAITNWSSPDQLAVWMQSDKTVDAVLRSIDPPPRTIKIDLFEAIL
jgi:hypothetical protein